MSTKRRLSIFICVLLAGVLGLMIWRASVPQEPVYEGRTLSSWLDHHVASSAARPPYNSPGWQQADKALRAIGTNAVPTLLKMISAKDPPPLVRKAKQFAARYPWTGINYRYASELNEEAEYAIQVLGTNAVSAVPGLIRIYEQNLSPTSQRCAAEALGNIGRGAEPAVPVLIRQFTHTNDDVRFSAVSAVMRISGKPEVVIPALTSVLQDSNVSVRWNALVGLSMFGKRARSAVPEILPMLNDEGAVGDSKIKGQVEVTLWRIAPEVVGKPLVVEDQTPMIADGKTAEAVKFVFNGKRRALIPKGRTLPTLSQNWNSDPRPRLTLYRGSPDSDDADHFLGHFEVLDVQEPESGGGVNISTLCIIANGQIILNARDNTRDIFLEIRRLPDNADK
jgi:hypothetical protein